MHDSSKYRCQSSCVNQCWIWDANNSRNWTHLDFQLPIIYYQYYYITYCITNWYRIKYWQKRHYALMTHSVTIYVTTLDYCIYHVLCMFHHYYLIYYVLCKCLLHFKYAFHPLLLLICKIVIYSCNWQ